MSRAALGLAAAVAVAAACSTAPYTGRRRILLTSESQEAAMGLQAYQESAPTAKMSKRSEWNAAVERVGKRIAAAADRSDFKWEFRVVAEDTINAFCLPGGKVAFYEGIMPICADDAGIAVVMGHEVGHAVERHGGERVSENMLVEGGVEVVSKILSGKHPELARQATPLLGGAAQVGITLPFSRSHESEADHVGLILMSKAGYDPHAAPEFWKRMIAGTSGSARQPEFLSTHPDPARRIEQLQGWMPEAMKLYEGRGR